MSDSSFPTSAQLLAAVVSAVKAAGGKASNQQIQEIVIKDLRLTPDQVAILPLSEKYNENCKEVLNLLNKYDIRGFVDDRNEKVGKKIRDAEVSKVPYMLIIGEKEIENDTLSVRKHGEGDIGTMTIEEFANYFNKELH